MSGQLFRNDCNNDEDDDDDTDSHDDDVGWFFTEYAHSDSGFLPAFPVLAAACKRQTLLNREGILSRMRVNHSTLATNIVLPLTAATSTRIR